VRVRVHGGRHLVGRPIARLRRVRSFCRNVSTARTFSVAQPRVLARRHHAHTQLSACTTPHVSTQQSQLYACSCVALTYAQLRGAASEATAVFYDCYDLPQFACNIFHCRRPAPSLRVRTMTDDGAARPSLALTTVSQRRVFPS
jgi:hypothetical protein